MEQTQVSGLPDDFRRLCVVHVEGDGHACGVADGGAEGGEVGGGVGDCPGEEEQHGWRVLGLGGAEGGDCAFEIVLRLVRMCFVVWGLGQVVAGCGLTTHIAGTPYLPAAAASKMVFALLSVSFGIVVDCRVMNSWKDGSWLATFHLDRSPAMTYPYICTEIELVRADYASDFTAPLPSNQWRWLFH